MTLVAVFGAVLLITHGDAALQAALPKDMPRYARFVQSGYDLTYNEPQGDWIACRPDVGNDTDLCRVTDNHGTVIYQGDFLPLRSNDPLPADELIISSRESPRTMWVQGPAEGGLVPVIPLANGKILVPAGDSEALADRWERDPEELARIEDQ